MGLFDDLFNFDLDIDWNLSSPTNDNSAEKNKLKEKLKKLDKCEDSLRDARSELSDFKTSVRSNWKGDDAKELINKITELERQFTKVMNSITPLKTKIEETIDGEN